MSAFAEIKNLFAGNQPAVLAQHPYVVATAVILAALAGTKTVRTAVLTVIAYVYVFIWPQNQVPLVALFENEEKPHFNLPRSIFSGKSRKITEYAKKRNMTYDQLIDSALTDCCETPKKGQLVKCWDFLFTWGDHYVNKDELEEWRRRSDSIADEALQALDAIHSVTPKDDILKLLEKEAKSDKAIGKCWDHLTSRPPPGAGAIPIEWYNAKRGKYTVEEELKAEKEAIERGQAVFYRYYGPILVALLHFSLAGGFASPRILRVLENTGYLVPSKRIEDDEKITKQRADRTFVRLSETNQWELDVMEGGAETLAPPSESNPSGGRGWSSIVRVRMLHTKVRGNILKQVAQMKGIYDLDKDGIPINQEDLAGTLASFSALALMTAPRFGINPSVQERNDFVNVWRHIGFYMGIAPDILQNHFTNAAIADRFTASVVRHLFSDLEVIVDKGLQPPPSATVPLLHSVANRPPFNQTKEMHFAISRFLMGPKLAKGLRVPETAPLKAFLLDVIIVTLWYPIWFGSWYRAGWDRKRQNLARPALRRVVLKSLGGKMTKFGGEGAGHAEAPEQKNFGKLLDFQLRLLSLEMLAVSAVLFVSPIAALAYFVASH